MNNEDMSDVFEKLNNLTSDNNISPEMINNLFNMLNNSNTSEGNTTSDFSNSNNFNSNNSNNNEIDLETILRIKKMMDSMQTKDDPRSNLLQSLKPYLNDSRKSKVDQYIKLMNMSKVLNVFPFIGGDQKNDR